MQYSIVALALAATTLAAATPEARRKRVGYPFCPFSDTPGCCQFVDSLGNGSNCILVGNQISMKGLFKRCAATGRTAVCCDDVTAGAGTNCQEV